jgi:hypothetical protein
MSLNIGNLKEIISGYLNTTPAGMILNMQDLCLLALNNARRTAELAHDFYYSKTNLTLAIASGGSSIQNAVGTVGSGIAVAGTLSPNITAGSFVVAGTYGGLPIYTQTVSSVVYTLSYNGAAWIITDEGFTPTDYWILTTASSSPLGVYTAHGTYTGSATLTGESQYVGIKRIENVQLSLSSGDLIPIEFLTDAAWRQRLLREYGREQWNPNLTSYQLGIGAMNPTCYQQGQNLFLVPASQFTMATGAPFPVTATLSCIQFLPDYTQDSDTDFFTEFGPEYLQWQGILEGNKQLKWFAQRREGNLDETNIENEVAAAMQSLLAWDLSVSAGTSTPNLPAPLPSAPQAQPQAA